MYNTGNANGSPYFSYRRRRDCTECYPNGNMGGCPTTFFRFIGNRVEYYNNGNGNGSPVYSMRVGRDWVEVYPNPNCASSPNWYFRKHGSLIEFFSNGNGNGSPIFSIARVEDIHDIIEGAFFGFVIGFR